ncbi:hypothetical protein LPC08_25340 (plasmid) [Roseomonas sp. OT10]|uniref:hypothetical protein n=1 Tax=Roseomonas cutis TaxID=2897332 RepID=UPI001E494F37|nr:hypothetical protein [Roseomonas sp. OT10]UFN51591.1 hypothetical protein LPC08_25340 [Roseomonas sp. OT10]
MAKGRDRERRWIVLGTDGRHVTLGRHSDPTEEEVLAAERSLSANGLAGWLAVMEGDYYARRGRPGLMMVRPLAAPTGAFKDAAAAFEAARARTLQPA